jgi:hypothetical protein
MAAWAVEGRRKRRRVEMAFMMGWWDCEDLVMGLC